MDAVDVELFIFTSLIDDKATPLLYTLGGSQNINPFANN